MFPQFKLSRSTAEGIEGHVSRTTQGSETWIGDGHIGYLRTESTLIEGRWKLRGECWIFAPKNDADRAKIASRSSWEILDGYWGERAELVLNEKLKWEKIPFEPRDAVRGSEVIKGGWDHEHCAVCWEKIGAYGQASGFVSASNIWICEQCHGKYVSVRSLSFVPVA